MNRLRTARLHPWHRCPAAPAEGVSAPGGSLAPIPPPNRGDETIQDTVDHEVPDNELANVVSVRLSKTDSAATGQYLEDLPHPAWYEPRRASPAAGTSPAHSRPWRLHAGGAGAATARSQLPAAKCKVIGARGLDLAGRPLMKAGVP